MTSQEISVTLAALTPEDRARWVVGRLTIALGCGEFEKEAARLFAVAEWDAYLRGLKAGKEEA